MKIGPHEFEHALILAPMAGISDRPFRSLCRSFGADYAITEMVSTKPYLWNTNKTRKRLDLAGETGPRVIQIAGAETDVMAAAARHCEALGADIVDVNMGCPAKKVCNKAAGSALMRDEALVRQILTAVCRAVSIPVSLKMRTGWDTEHRNGPTIAKIAEDCGVSAITVHGRTRACAFRGAAEYDTIATIKGQLVIPVIANGDIRTPGDAMAVLKLTGADGLMVGRAAQGDPWLFQRIKAALAGKSMSPPTRRERLDLMHAHVSSLHGHYGDIAGVRIARKHVGWYLDAFPAARVLRGAFNRIDDPRAQLEYVESLQETSVLDRAA
ncbi:MAG: tRNA dihydrouridine synthase DusB [Gammaproteobacteria bacterium]|nr:tRNA dihydrouridine synthase DusB [Gammaproteobacteria bacterium]